MAKPTAGMKSEARKGLDWRKEFGRGGTRIGLERANQIVNGENLSDDVKTEIDGILADLETTRLLGVAKYEAANDLLHSLSTNPEGVEGSEGAGPKTSLNEAVKRYAFELAVKKYNVYDRSVKILSSYMHKYAKEEKMEMGTW